MFHTVDADVFASLRGQIRASASTECPLAAITGTRGA
jgi:hypothetical protein